ncbi:MAG: bile acid:sodium symporter family protein [Pseudomonadota bacterium]
MNWRALIPDRFVMVLLATIIVASLLPLSGVAAQAGEIIAAMAIFLLFLLHGLRLPRTEVLHAIRDWRLQAMIALFVFGIMPLVGLGAATMMQGLLPAGLITGLIFVGLLPSTVQSAISYASLAGGNIAASVVASALLNLAAIIITPLLVILTIGPGDAQDGAATGGALIGKIMLILLLPFCLGQLLQSRLGAWARKQARLLGFMDKSAIAIAVYVAFGSAVAGGLWQQVDARELGLLCVIIALMLIFAFGGSWALSSTLDLARSDRISLMFSGSHKSIATGAPMAALIFAGPEAGMVILPALIYHQLQLIISAPLANRLQRPVLKSRL